MSETTNSILSLDKIKKIEHWLTGLHKDRKCKNTNLIIKIVNEYSKEEQLAVCDLICCYIKKELSKSVQSDIVSQMISSCNMLNGCFDNFTHATDAANMSFNEIILFIDLGINECLNAITTKQTPNYERIKILDLLHCLSRVLVLTLKLRRSGKCQQYHSKSFPEIQPNVRVVLAKLSYKVANLLLVEEILMDTKNNFVMSSLLVRELLCSKEKLVEYHQKLSSVLSDVLEEDYNLNVLKFLVSNSALNTWSSTLVDVNLLETCLGFYVKCCESYSSDTTIILNVSRALLLLIKSDCFHDYAKNHVCSDQNHINSLLSCIWMLMDHPVACVRNSSKDFLQLLTVYEKFKLALLSSLPLLPCDKRSYFITLASLANECGTRLLIEYDKRLYDKLFDGLCDPTLVSHVMFALESLIMKDTLLEENFNHWVICWIERLLWSMSNVPLSVASDVEKLLDKIFMQYPSAAFFIINEKNRYRENTVILPALRICHRRGLKAGTTVVARQIDTTDINRENKWKDLIDMNLLMGWLIDFKDDVRLTSFSLIIETLKTTEIYTWHDFTLIKHFLSYNLNNQNPSTRQKILSLIKKMLARFSDSLAVIKRCQKSSPDTLKDLSNYKEFQNWIIEFCFANIFDGVNFSRLNTVLSTLLYCVEYMDNIEMDESHIDVNWKKILVALRNSYEENKILAVTLSRKLNIIRLIPNASSVVSSLFRKAYDLCSKMEPPNVLNGAYLIQILIESSLFVNVLEEHVEGEAGDTRLMCVGLLAKRLKEQVKLAEKSIIKAAVTGPMYGLLFAIRLIIRDVNFADGPENLISKWSILINDLIKCCFSIIGAVSSVVNSSSPEGHLPSDFQYDLGIFLNQYSITEIKDECQKEGEEKLTPSEVSSIERQMEYIKIRTEPREIEELLEECNKWIKRFNRLFLLLNNSTCFSKENSKEMINMLISNESLLNELKLDSRTKIYVECLNAAREKLNECLATYEGNKFNSDRPTAQVLLLCAWRSIKEACLFLGDVLSKLPLDEMFQIKLITEDKIILIGEKFREMLCNIRHRGAFEQAYIGFSQLLNALWRCSRKSVSELPWKWLLEILEEIKLPLEKQAMKLCSNRRSAGLPFMIQAIITSEIKCTNSAKIQTFEVTMNTLLDLVESEGESVSLDCKIHSLNILRALFKHAELGDYIAPYVSRGLIVAIRGSKASAWSIRNSCNLLFSALVIRIFGVARSKDTLSKKNRMTSRTFFQRYPEMYEFFLNEMKTSFENEHVAHEYYPQSNVFLILLILGRLYPSPNEGPSNIDLSAFLPAVNLCCYNNTLKIRELGARAFVSLVSPENLKLELDKLFSSLRYSIIIVNSINKDNKQHGILLQLKALLNDMSSNHSSLLNEAIEENGRLWAKYTHWILSDKYVPYIIKFCYVQVLRLMAEVCVSFTITLENILMDNDLFRRENEFSGEMIPFRSLYLETLYTLKLESLCLYDSSSLESERENFIRLMLGSGIDEVEVVALKFFIQNRHHLENPLHPIIILNYRVVLRYVIKHIKSFINNLEDTSKFVLKATTKLCIQWLMITRHSHLWEESEILELSNEDICKLLSALSCLMEYVDTDISVSSLMLYSSISCSLLRSNTISAETIAHFTKVLHIFADPDSDIQQRVAVAQILEKNFDVFCPYVVDNEAFNICMLPLRLMADDSLVREKAYGIISNMFMNQYLPEEFDTAPSLKAQECLLDCYYFLYGEEKFNLIVQMVGHYLSSNIKTINGEYTKKQNEAGVFEKGNPNPTCEEFIFANLLSKKLEDWKQRTDFDFAYFMTKKLETTHVKVLRDIFPTIIVPNFPNTLHELCQTVIEIMSENEPYSEDDILSMTPFYLNQIKKTLSF